MAKRRKLLEDRFALGVNLPWLDNQYGHDFGRNESLGAKELPIATKDIRTILTITSATSAPCARRS